MHKILSLVLAMALFSLTNTGLAAQKKKKSVSKAKATTSKKYSPKKAKAKTAKTKKVEKVKKDIAIED